MKNYNFPPKADPPRAEKLKNITFYIIVFSFSLFAFRFSLTHASETNGTIVSGGNNGYAWSNQAGWINFGCTNCGISITDSGITGHAWSNNYGWINMAPSNGGVTVAADGALSGYAWGSSLGWINFSGVSINSSGKFVGTASGTNVGTLTFDCANCSVATDFRPQNFRTPAPAPSGGGGGGIPGSITSVPPASVTASNVPLTISPAQSGTLIQNLSGDKRVELRVDRGSSSETITFVVTEQAVSVEASVGIQVVGDALFNVQAFNTAGERVRSFLQPIQIILTVPEELQGRTDLGVYFFDEAELVWVKIPEAVFSDYTISFFVDHLTLFSILSAADLPPVLTPFFPITVRLEGEALPPVLPSGAEEPAEEETPPVIFDIIAEPIKKIGRELVPLRTFFFIFFSIVIAALVVWKIRFYMIKRRIERNRRHI